MTTKTQKKSYVELVAHVREYGDRKPTTRRVRVYLDGAITIYDLDYQYFTGLHSIVEADRYHLRQIAGAILHQHDQSNQR